MTERRGTGPARLLLEIGVEEMPAAAARSALERLKAEGRRLLVENRLLAEDGQADLRILGTPRRLTLIADALPAAQRVETKEVKGPPAKIAFNEKGDPGPPAVGFAKTNGLDVSQLEVKEIDGGSYVTAVVETPGRSAAEVLPAILSELVGSIEFAKAMRWGNGTLRFIRPLRWFLALYGPDAVDFEIDGLRSGRLTFGHRFLKDGPFELRDAGEYEEVMDRALVMVDPEARRESIFDMVNEAAAGIGGRAFADPTDRRVLDEVNWLVENPHVVIGDFDEDFLKIPRAVLATAMKSHQRYFPIEDAQGKLAAKFAVVHNGDPKYDKQIRQGHQRVLRARLADAAFFFTEDSKTTLEFKVGRLDNVVWQAKLGTLKDKTRRIAKLAAGLAEKLEFAPDEADQTARAAHLCKADLTTSMVIEFTDLQGVIGGEYAAVDGEDPRAAAAIREHYLPRFAGDAMPEGKISAIIALADKLDTLAGCFLAGLIPTGSADPYSLRRQAAGVVQIMAQTRWPFAILGLVKVAIAGYKDIDYAGGSPGPVAIKLRDFILARLRRWLAESGSSAEAVGSVIGAGHDVVVEITDRVRLIDAHKGKKELEDVKIAFTRCHNLARPEISGDADKNLFEDTAEERLMQETEKAESEIKPAVESGDLERVMMVLASMRPAIDDFFEAVLVMAEDEKVKENRLRLLSKCVGLSEEIADFSQLP